MDTPFRIANTILTTMSIFFLIQDTWGAYIKITEILKFREIQAEILINC